MTSSCGVVGRKRVLEQRFSIRLLARQDRSTPTSPPRMAPDEMPWHFRVKVGPIENCATAKDVERFLDQMFASLTLDRLPFEWQF